MVYSSIEGQWKNLSIIMYQQFLNCVYYFEIYQNDFNRTRLTTTGKNCSNYMSGSNAKNSFFFFQGKQFLALAREKHQRKIL